MSFLPHAHTTAHHPLFFLISCLISLMSTACGHTTDPLEPGDVQSLSSDTSEEDAYQVKKIEQVVVTPTFDLDGEAFYDKMWPTDLALSQDGTVTFQNFPNKNNTLLRILRAETEKIKGFATMPVIYTKLDVSLEHAQMPDPTQTITPTGGTQLIELGSECGARVPVELDLDTMGDAFIDANTMRATPLPGFILKPRTTYAFVIMRNFSSHVEMKRPAGFDGLLQNTSNNEKANSIYTPLRDCLKQAKLDANDIAVATVFTTQDTRTGMKNMSDAMLDPTQTEDPIVTTWRKNPEKSSKLYTVHDGFVRTPHFQVGTSPFRTQGGLSYDEDKNLIVQRYEEVPFSVAVPHKIMEPAPVLLFVGGTGASHFGYLRHDIIQKLLSAGFVIVNFVPQFHAPRGRYSYEDIVTLTFNYLNPAAGRTVFRQQAAENVYMSRLIRGVLQTLDGVPKLNTEHLLYGGHSQGALAGALTAGVSDAFYAYGFNGLGGYISSTIVFRKDTGDLERTLRTFIGIERPLDIKHPVVQIVQLGAEVVDPHNYARSWQGKEGVNDGSHVFVVNGGLDVTSPKPGINSMTIAADLDRIDESGWLPDPYGIWPRTTHMTPLSSNRKSASGKSLTQATYLLNHSNHYSIFNHPRAATFMLNFWNTARMGTPTIK